MTVEALTKGLELFLGVLSAVKEMVNLLPDSSEKDAAAEALEQAERQFRIAEAEIAKGLGYPLCRCTWPPQIMLFKGREGRASGAVYYECAECGHRERRWKAEIG